MNKVLMLKLLLEQITKIGGALIFHGFIHYGLFGISFGLENVFIGKLVVCFNFLPYSYTYSYSSLLFSSSYLTPHCSTISGKWAGHWLWAWCSLSCSAVGLSTVFQEAGGSGCHLAFSWGYFGLASAFGSDREFASGH
jgi:hypothetical protein